MNSKATGSFWKLYANLPAIIKKQARDVFKSFQEDPYYPSLYFKRVHSSRPIFSVRISKDYRAVGILQENEIIWFWIGSHSEYDKLLGKM